MAQKLSDLKWQNRILITNDKPLLKEQLSILKADSSASMERKLALVYHDSSSTMQIWPLKRSISLNQVIFGNKKEVILIGLDGGIKYRSEEPFEKNRLFSIIDSMPMRAAEMKRDNE